MHKTLSSWLVLLALLAGLTLTHRAQPVQAASVGYQALTSGTAHASMATQYFVQPATVVANGGQYLVTMTIRTSASLGKWPVTVLAIDGSGPANVTKTRHGGQYDYTYAFQTAALDRRIKATIAINVAGVYAAQQPIDFQFAQSALPKLDPKATPAARVVPERASTARATRQQAAAIRALNRQNARTQRAVLLGGPAVVLLLAAGAWGLIRRH